MLKLARVKVSSPGTSFSLISSSRFVVALAISRKSTNMRQHLISSAALVGATHALKYTCTPSAIQAALPQGASVNFAYSVAANSTFEVPKSDTGYPDSPPNLPALCAASIQVESVDNTTFGFGIFLPEEWNGRFLAVGNGGFAGGINYVDMVGLRPDYAKLTGC